MTQEAINISLIKKSISNILDDISEEFSSTWTGMNGVNNHSELEEAIIYQGVKAVLYGETIIDNDVVMDIYNEEVEEQQQMKFNNMRALLYSQGFTKEDVAKLAEYQKD